MENTKTADVFKKMAKWQMLATTVVAMGALGLYGIHGALSALAGGWSAIAGGYAASLIAKRSDDKKEPGAILISLLKAEAVKIIVIAALLLIIFKLYTAKVPLALILGLGASAILSGAAVFSLNEKSEI